MTGLSPKIILFFFLSFPLMLISQEQTLSSTHNCASHMVLDQSESEDPALYKQVEKTLDWLESKDQITPNAVKNDQQIIVPVVIHVVYSNSYENVSNAQINNQMSILNADFNKENNISLSYQGIAADVNIKFELATQDPYGAPTNGIVRKQTSVPTFNISFNSSFNQSPNIDMKADALGGSDAWPNDRYLNIWVVEMQAGLRGFATFPNSVYDEYDGVVMSYEYFGSIGTGDDNSNYAGGRTLTHEVGHWLSLKHIWGGGCALDDGVADTPDQQTYTTGCPGYSYTCGSNDQWQNFMDYTYDACLMLFSEGQKSRMRSVFDEGGPRADFQHQLALGLLGDVVWSDDNMDGMQQPSEPGVSNVQVSLYDMNYQFVKSEITDAYGNYLISEVPAGEYFLEFDYPISPASFTVPGAGPATMDSDVDHSNGTNTTKSFALDAGEYKSDLDAGLVMETVLSAEKKSLALVAHEELTAFVFDWLYTDEIESMILEVQENGSQEWQEAALNEAFMDLSGEWYIELPLNVVDSYYRIKTISLSGRADFSNIVVQKAHKSDNSEIKIYPNPSDGLLNIHLNNVGDIANISIYDSLGKKVVIENATIGGTSEDEIYQIDTSRMQEGIYFVSIKTGNSYYNKTLYIAH